MATGDTVLDGVDYRVVFWEQQLPPVGSSIQPDKMAWACYALDLTDARDVHEAIAWAESNLDQVLDGVHPGGLHGERTYVLYARVPDEATYLQIAGDDPTSDRRRRRWRLTAIDLVPRRIEQRPEM